MSPRLAWVTDPHFDHTTVAGLTRLVEQVHATTADAVVLTGDVAVGPTLRQWLRAFGRLAERPLYFVLGNHDCWGLDVAGARAIAAAAAAELDSLHYLTGAEPVTLAPGTALVGHDGWYDGRAGHWRRSRLRMFDWKRIADFSGAPDPAARVAAMRRLADEAVTTLLPAVEAAAQAHAQVLVATHVPPWRRAGRHRGAPLDEHTAPWYVNQALGRALEQVAVRHPAVTFRVLAGHTHVRVRGVRLGANLTCDVGGARYGRPTLEDVIAL